MLLDIEKLEDSLVMSYYDKDGNVAFKTYQTPDKSNWAVCKESDKYKSNVVRNWDGRAVKKTRAYYLNKYSITEFLKNLPQKEQDDLFAANMPRTYFVDIEVEVFDDFPDPEQANNKITSISIVTPENGIIIFALRDLAKKEIQKIEEDTNKYFEKVGETYTLSFVKFDSEYDLLYTFLTRVRNFPMVTGWNFIGFDWQYIINRSKKLMIDPSISSPVGKMSSDKIPLPMHVGIMDYLEIYRKWDRSIEIKENFTLDKTGEYVLGLTKIKYDGSLQDLYEKDFTKYIYYNAVDTVLVQQIHKHLRTMDIPLTLSALTHISLYKAASPVTVTETLLCKKLLDKNLVMGVEYKDEISKKGQYTGAYVKKPYVGRHRAVASFDFASLYPSIMRQFNISPESFIREIPMEKPKDENDMDTRNKNKKIIKDTQYQGGNGEERKVIVSVSGAVFKKEKSLLKEVLDELYGQRRQYKKRYFNYEMKAEEIKDILKKRGEL